MLCSHTKKTCSSQHKLQSDVNWQNHTQPVSNSLYLSLHTHSPAPTRLRGRGWGERFAFTLKFHTCSVYMGANPGKLSAHPPHCTHNSTWTSWPQSTNGNDALPYDPGTPSKVLPLVYSAHSWGLSWSSCCCWAHPKFCSVAAKGRASEMKEGIPVSSQITENCLLS